MHTWNVEGFLHSNYLKLAVAAASREEAICRAVVARGIAAKGYDISDFRGRVSCVRCESSGNTRNGGQYGQRA
jgi:hypothetical protein